MSSTKSTDNGADCAIVAVAIVDGAIVAVAIVDGAVVAVAIVDGAIVAVVVDGAIVAVVVDGVNDDAIVAVDGVNDAAIVVVDGVNDDAIVVVDAVDGVNDAAIVGVDGADVSTLFISSNSLSFTLFIIFLPSSVILNINTSSFPSILIMSASGSINHPPSITPFDRFTLSSRPR